MNAIELRIGNYLKGSQIVRVARIFDLDKIGIGSGDPYFVSGDSPCLSGIEITPKWLTDFGFKQINKVDYITVDFAIYKKDNILWEDCGSCGVDDYWFKSKVEYVHQLQNLYFALTGKELEII